MADLTAKTAKELGHKEIVLECYKIAFQSESTLNHFLRLYEIENGKGILDIELIKVKTLPEKSFLGFGSINNEMAINIISKEHKIILHFFNAGQSKVLQENLLRRLCCSAYFLSNNFC